MQAKISVSEMTVDAAELGRVLGIDISTIRKLDKDGVLQVISQEGKTRHVYAVGPSVRRYVAYQCGLAESDAPARDAMAAARLKKVNIEISREQLKLDLERKETMPCNMVSAFVSTMIRNARTTALSMPNSCAQFCAQETDTAKVYKILEEAVRDMLNKMSETSLAECLSKYTQVETIEGGEKYVSIDFGNDWPSKAGA